MIKRSGRLLIGVDGGGTTCRVAIGTREDGILVRSKGGPANVTSDPQGAVKNILSTIEAAAKKAKIASSELSGAFAHLGLAGVMTKKDAQWVATQLPFADVNVSDDRPTALEGALGGADGHLLSVGTGSFAASRVDGTFKTIGGWGLCLGDQGSGAWLGLEALQNTLLCCDGVKDHNDLTRFVLSTFQDDPNEILAFSVNAAPKDYGCLLYTSDAADD